MSHGEPDGLCRSGWVRERHSKQVTFEPRTLTGQCQASEVWGKSATGRGNGKGEEQSSSGNKAAHMKMARAQWARPGTVTAEAAREGKNLWAVGRGVDFIVNTVFGLEGF